jgi:4-amino-4-deoxy-L-arabinose transferase-like glycosyltransferase
MGFKQKLESRFGRIPWIHGLLLGFLGVLIISIVILSSVPPVSKDALVHHLAVPKLYLEHGGMYEIPSMPFSYYPMNLHLLYLIPLNFGQDILPKFIHFLFALFTAYIIFRYLKPRTSMTFGLVGVVFFISIPIIIKLSTTAYVDLGVIFFSTASVLLLFKWMENGFRFGPLILAAVLCGLAMGTKYNGLISFLLLTLFVPFIYSRYQKKGKNIFFRALAYAGLFFLVALTVFSPWMIRNYNWKGNPIYPLYNEWFLARNAVSRQAVVRQIPEKRMNRGIFTFRSMIYKEKWWEITLLPVRIFFQGEDGNPQYFDGKLTPFLFFLPIFALYRIREGPEQVKREKKIMFVFALLFLLFTLFTRDMRIRYFSPIIPALVILSMFGLVNIREIILKIPSRHARAVGTLSVGLLVILSLTINATYILEQFREVQPFQYLEGEISRDEYISKHRREYPALQYVNGQLPADALIMFVFSGKRGYYCDRPYVVSGELRLRRIFHKAKSPKEVLAAFKRGGFTHLFINNAIFIKWVEDNFEKGKKAILEDLFTKHIKTLYHENGFSVSIIEYPLP